MELSATQKSKVEAAILVTENNIFRCVAVKNCIYAQEKSLHHGNFIRHVQKKHPEKCELLGLPPLPKVKEPTPKRRKTDKISVETTQTDVLLGTLQLVSVHSLPLSYPEWTGFKTLAGPLWKASNLPMNRKTLTDMVDKGSALGRKFLADEMKGRPLHLKIDSASRRNHHSFAVNAAFYKDGKIVTRSLVIKEMIKSQTAKNLRQTIVEEVIQRYGLLPEQILTVVHDNGANMVASVTNLRVYIKEGIASLLKKETSALDEVIGNSSSHRLVNLVETDAALEETGTDMDVEDEPQKEIEQTDDEDGETGGNEPDDTQSDFEEDEEGILSVAGTRCAAHTCQLAVYDVLKKHSRQIENVKKLCKNTRLGKYREVFSTHNAHLPPIPGATRWNSIYLMLKSLREQKSFFLMLQNDFEELNFSKHWAFIDVFCDALEPIFFLTVSLQREHVPLSEFYSEWLICQAKLNSLTSNYLAKHLLTAMEQRLLKLTETIQFKVCLYIDPRFNYIGSNRMTATDKELAQNYLLQLWTRLNALEGKLEDHQDTSHEEPNDEASDFVEQYLDRYFDRDSSGSGGRMQPVEDKILQQIKELELRPKVRIRVGGLDDSSSVERFDIVKYWIGMRTSHHDVFRMASAILAAPSTQVTVERAFSGLKLVLTDQRQRLSDQRIQDLMVLKLNQDLLPFIAEKLCSEI